MTVDRQQIRRDAELFAKGANPESLARLARHCLALLTELEEIERSAATAGEYLDRATETIAQLESRLANVPALVEALERIVEAAATVKDSDDLGGPLNVMGLISLARRDLAAWHENNGGT